MTADQVVGIIGVIVVIALLLCIPVIFWAESSPKNKDRKSKDMFKRKKSKIQDLEDRLAVVEFEKEAKGCTFIVGFSTSNKVWDRSVKFLSENGKRVITQEVKTTCFKVTQNGKYLEFWKTDILAYTLVKAMRVSGDKLVDMDVDVYNKAFYPKKENPFKPIVDISAETKRATDALDALAYAIKSVPRGR